MLVITLAVGGGLGAILLTEFVPIPFLLFSIACVASGKVFYQIDKKISKK